MQLDWWASEGTFTNDKEASVGVKGAGLLGGERRRPRK